MIDKKTILDIFNFRHACKEFRTDKKIPQEDLQVILETARLSPTSLGYEHWKILVLRDPALRKAIQPYSWGMVKHLDNEACEVLFFIVEKNPRYDNEKFPKIFERRGIPADKLPKALERYKSFQVEDMKLLETPRALYDWACKQSYIALGNVMTAAAMMGIDSCAIEGMHYDSVNKILADAGAFDPEKYAVSVAVVFGYRANDAQKRLRLDLDELVTYL